MKAKHLVVVALLIAAPILAATVVTDDPQNAPELTVHEWGTFTSIAGPDGQAINWRPAGGPADLPCFVALTDPTHSKDGLGPDNVLGGRAGEGTVRMETPVLYFYSPREEMVNVNVSFPHGLITEWYPSGPLVSVTPFRPEEQMKGLAAATGKIEWNNVKVMPGATEAFPVEEGQSHYYAARRTGSAPLKVGTQQEKFLFYRGIASFNPPIAAQVNPEGKIAVRNLGTEVIPSIILFENRGGKLGYRIIHQFDGQATLELPELTSDFAVLQRSLEGILQTQGMYPAEASAMVDTWKDTWFEQGTRLFYIVPSHTVDTILPLTITPNPVQIARAFVGRMEIITPATQNEVRAAIQTDNRAVMETYGRFIEPIANTIWPSISETERSRAMLTIDSIRAGYIGTVRACTQKLRTR